MNEAELIDRLAVIKKALKVPGWYRYSLLVARFHRLCQKKYGVPHRTQGKSGWGLRDTAAALQISMPSVQESVNVIKLIKKHPEARHFKTRDEVFRSYQTKD